MYIRKNLKKKRSLMFNSKTVIITAITVLITAGVFCTSSLVSAQSIMALGELNAKGEVFVGSSDGKWAPSGSTYPLLQNTSIRTKDGFASLFLIDSSRIDLSKETIAVVDGTPANVTMKLTQGVIAFNMVTSSSFTVTSPSSTISIGKSADVVHKVSLKNQKRALGVIIVNDKGTEIKSIAGVMTISTNNAVVRQIATGENMFVRADNTFKVYKTQATANDKGTRIIQAGHRVEVKTSGLEGIYKIDPEGNITILNIKMHLEGLTEAEAAELVAKVLSKELPVTLVNILDDEIVAALFPASEKAGALFVGATFVGTSTAISLMGDGPWDDEKKLASPYGF
jgi:hypothetical protein